MVGDMVGGDRPVVSVLMCVHNEPSWMIEQAIQSLITQTFRDFEVVIVDDHSSNPDTLAALASAANSDSRIRILTSDSHGFVPSLNFGVRQCRAELICRHDADDWSEPVRLETQVGYLHAHPEVSLLGANVWIHQESGAPLWQTNLPLANDDIRRALQRGNAFAHGSVCFRRSAVLTVGGYRSMFQRAQDYDLFWRLSERGIVSNLPQALYHYRARSSSISGSTWRDRQHSIALIKALARQRLAVGVDNPEEAEQQLAAQDPATESAGLLACADHALLAGQYKQSLALYLSPMALKHAPWLGMRKLLRAVLFILVPAMRRRLFDPSNRSTRPYSARRAVADRRLPDTLRTEPTRSEHLGRP